MMSSTAENLSALLIGSGALFFFICFGLAILKLSGVI
jgi:hypothetical protein